MPYRTYPSARLTRTRAASGRRMTYATNPRFKRHRLRSGLNIRTGGFQGMELKFYDVNKAATSLSTSATAAGGEQNPAAPKTLNTVAQGTSESNRIGRQMKMWNISIKGIISIAAQANQTAADVHPSIFIALVLDKQVNGALLNSEDVFKNIAGSTASSTNLERNLEFIQRFDVLKLWKRNVKDIGMVYDGTNIEVHGSHTAFHMVANLHGLITNFCGTTEDVANVVDNGLNLIAFASHVGFTPQLLYGSRLRFTG